MLSNFARAEWIGVAFLLVLVAGATSARAEGSASALGVSNALNPAISFNALFLGTLSDGAGSDTEDLTKDGMEFTEAELVLSSVVDPYLQAFCTVTVSPEEGTGLEEGYVFGTNLPKGLGLKAGKFKVPFGKHNELHRHAYPWITPPVGVQETLGPEGVTDVGVMGSYLLPTPFYLEATAYAVDGQAELFDAARERLAAGGRLYSLFELGESATLELGGSVLDGPANDVEVPERLDVTGADLTFKWQDLGQTSGAAFVWQNEILHSSYDGSSPDQAGFYTLARYRALRRTWLGAGFSRYDVDEPEAAPDRPDVNEIRGQLAFLPSEFSALRFEVRHRDFDGDASDWTASVQLNFTIGSHPAHKY